MWVGLKGGVKGWRWGWGERVEMGVGLKSGDVGRVKGSLYI